MSDSSTQLLEKTSVYLRNEGSFTHSEAAQALGVSLATAERYWTFARSWLYAELADPDQNPNS